MDRLTSKEMNCIVYRYLTDSGFQHTAFNFKCEAGLDMSTIDANTVPFGALVSVVLKGLRHLEMEANFNNKDKDGDADFTFIRLLDLLTKDADRLRQIVEEKSQNQDKEKEKGKGKEKESDAMVIKPAKRKFTNVILSDDEEEEKRLQTLRLKQIDIGTSSRPKTGARIPQSDVMILKGHTAEVYDCAWNPSGFFLASGSKDSTAMIWTIPNRINNYGLQSGPANGVVLKHSKGRSKEKGKDVTQIGWHMDGTLLATASFDGKARIWSRNGDIKSTFSGHEGPVFCVKWNKNCDYLLSGSCDASAIVWDVKANVLKQQFKFPSGPILDLDWQNNNSFAVSSTDHRIYVCTIGKTQPVRSFYGHKSEVNCVKWDPTGSLLASCSDDTTAKIWSMKKKTYIHDLKSHTKEVYKVKWSPTGLGTNNPNKKLLLATASYDATINLWDVEYGRVVRTLSGHRESVYSLGFSPNGEYLASGSMDRLLHIWSVKDGSILKTYTSNGSIFQVCWNKEGNRIAACTSNHNVCVLDFRM